MAFYVAKGEKRIIYKWGHLGCTRERKSNKMESTTGMPKTTNLVLQNVTRPYIICFGVCGEYAVNKKEYGSKKKKHNYRGNSQSL